MLLEPQRAAFRIVKDPPIDKDDPSRGSEGPIKLIPEMAPAARYPVEALGPILEVAARAIASKVQAPIQLAAQSVLSVASLAAQAHADVMLPFGQPRPLSLFLFSIAESGDRKTSADHEAQTSVRRYERVLAERYQAENKVACAAIEAWRGQVKVIQNNRKLDYESRKAALIELGLEPQRPLHPFLVVPEPTIEGLFKAWPDSPASLGLYSSEGGSFVGGHGMSTDNRLKTGAALSQLWDGDPVKRLRAGDGVTILDGRRLSLHLMIQPNAAMTFLADPVLRDQGLFSRLLVAFPESIAGQRLYRAPALSDDAAIVTFNQVIFHLLSSEWPLADGKRNELAPRSLRMTSEATAVWTFFHDAIETRMAPTGDFAIIRGFAGKAAEHAARIAGVLTIVSDPNALRIDGTMMRHATALADWYTGEALRFGASAMADPSLIRAKKLLDWLQSSDRKGSDEPVSIRDVTRRAPASLRTKVVAENAVRLLCEHGWLIEHPGRSPRWSLKAEPAE